MTERPERESVTKEFKFVPFTLEEQTSFEVAIDAIGAAIGACSKYIALEEAKSSPDQTRLEMLNDRVTELARRRRELRAGPPEKMREISSHYFRMADEIAEGLV
jgi:hypothetical protein